MANNDSDALLITNMLQSFAKLEGCIILNCHSVQMELFFYQNLEIFIWSYSYNCITDVIVQFHTKSHSQPHVRSKCCSVIIDKTLPTDPPPTPSMQYHAF